MAKDPKPVADLSAATKQTMEQMSGAVDTYFDYLKRLFRPRRRVGQNLVKK